MKLLKTMTLAAALAALPVGMAMADCVDPTTSASTSDQPKTAPVAKDGSTAPLETGATSGSATTATPPAQEESAQKDGGTMPLATEEGGGNTNIATSQQDVEAQQEGEATAAAKAADKAENCPEKG